MRWQTARWPFRGRQRTPDDETTTSRSSALPRLLNKAIERCPVTHHHRRVRSPAGQRHRDQRHEHGGPAKRSANTCRFQPDLPITRGNAAVGAIGCWRRCRWPSHAEESAASLDRRPSSTIITHSGRGILIGVLAWRCRPRIPRGPVTHDGMGFSDFIDFSIHCGAVLAVRYECIASIQACGFVSPHGGPLDILSTNS